MATTSAADESLPAVNKFTNGFKVYKDPNKNILKIRLDGELEHSKNGHYSIVDRAFVTRMLDDGHEEKLQEEVAIKKIKVAIKKVKPFEKERLSNFREIFLLRILTARYPHKNIIQLLYTRRSKYGNNDLYVPYNLVFTFMLNTLQDILKDAYIMERNELDLKLYTWQLFSGLYHLRKLKIIHRDIKSANLLVDFKTGILKISDFGSVVAVHRDHRRPLNPYAVTRPYRPPELLLNSRHYDCMIDVWSAGCVVGEIFLGRKLFSENGNGFAANGARQLQLIYKLLGTPSAEELQTMNVRAKKFIPAETETVLWPLEELNLLFDAAGYSEADNNPAPLLVQVLNFNPRKRLHGRDLLSHPFFDQLFTIGQTRHNGNPVSMAISEADRRLIIGTEV